MNSQQESQYWCAGMPMTRERRLQISEVKELRAEFEELAKEIGPRAGVTAVAAVLLLGAPVLGSVLLPGKGISDTGFSWMAPVMWVLILGALSIRERWQWRIWIERDIKIDRVGVFEGQINGQQVTAEVMLGTARVWRLDGFPLPERVTTVVAVEDLEEFRKKGRAPILNALCRPIPHEATGDGEGLVLSREEGEEIRKRLGVLVKAAFQAWADPLRAHLFLGGTWMYVNYPFWLPGLLMGVAGIIGSFAWIVKERLPGILAVRNDALAGRAVRDQNRPEVVMLPTSKMRWTVEETPAAWR